MSKIIKIRDNIHYLQKFPCTFDITKLINNKWSFSRYYLRNKLAIHKSSIKSARVIFIKNVILREINLPQSL